MIATEVTNELVAQLNGLLTQLSASASVLTTGAVRDIVESDASTLLVATRDDEVIGMLTLVVFAIPSGRRAWIEDVVVDVSARGSGVGEALTLAAIDEARRRSVRSIDLTSRPTRVEAHALYQKLGFVTRETNVYRFFLESEEPAKLILRTRRLTIPTTVVNREGARGHLDD